MLWLNCQLEWTNSLHLTSGNKWQISVSNFEFAASFFQIHFKLMLSIISRSELESSISIKAMAQRDMKGFNLPQKRNAYALGSSTTGGEGSHDQFEAATTSMRPVAISHFKSSELSQGTPTSQVTIVENKKSPTPGKSGRFMMMNTNSRPPLMRKQQEVTNLVV